VSEYKDIELIKLVNVAVESCAELGAISGNVVINYETGKTFEVPDAETALFIASAREIVLELARRIREMKTPYSGLSKSQWQTLKAAQGEFGMSIRTNEETKMRQAYNMVTEGLLTKEYDPRAADGRVMFFYITMKGRAALVYEPKE